MSALGIARNCEEAIRQASGGDSTSRSSAHLE